MARRRGVSVVVHCPGCGETWSTTPPVTGSCMATGDPIRLATPEEVEAYNSERV